MQPTASRATWSASPAFGPLAAADADRWAVAGSSSGEVSTPLDVHTVRNYNSSVEFEWDEAKCRRNIFKHGIDFADLSAVFQDVLVTILDDRFDHDVTRCLTLGLLKGWVVVIAHNETESAIRIISARKATRDEEKSYYEQITD